MLFKCFLLLSLCLLSTVTFAQPKNSTTQGADPFRMKDDTATVNRLNDLGSKWQYANHDSAVIAVNRAITVAQKINYPLGLATAYRIRGTFYADQQLSDSARMFYDKALPLVKNEPDKKYIRQQALLKHNYGVLYHYKQQYDSASALYFEAIKLFEQIGDEGSTFYSYNNLVTIKSFLKDNVAALEYASKACIAAEKLNNSNFLAMATNAKITALMQLKKYREARPLLSENKLRLDTINNLYAKGGLMHCFDEYYRSGTQQYDSAIYYSKLGLGFMTKINNQYEIASHLNSIGLGFNLLATKEHTKNKFDSAIHYLSAALNICDSFHLDDTKLYVLPNLADAFEGSGNADSANALLKQYIKLNDSLQSKHAESQVSELEAKYQTEKKDHQIKLQEAEIKQKNTFNKLLIATAVGILLISVLLYRNYRNKQTIQQQTINELETERKLTATKSLLEGEEKERSRIAKDLHDGLSGMLSGVKYSLQNMQENLIMTPENQQSFTRSLDMLDSSIAEMRRVAQNMMPEVLLNFGLDAALKDYIAEVNKSGLVRFVYQSMGIEQWAADKNTSLSIYRITQELINNVIKHSGATQALVQVLLENKKLVVSVEDNGKGMPALNETATTGMGWKNIRSRVELLKGTLNVHASPETGTVVNLEFTIS